MNENTLARLYRFECPTPHMLGEYWLNLLPRAERQHIREHLADCPLCQAELRDLEAFMGEEAEARPSLGAHIRQAVASLLPSSGMMAPALGGVRGEDGLFYQAEDVDVSLAIEPEAVQPGLRSLVGYVQSSTTGNPLAGCTARLVSGDLPFPSQRVDELGNFLFSHLVPGIYDLFIDTPDLTIRIPDLDIA